MIKGQDWAGYQSPTPSTTGLDFAFTKATEGTGYKNPNMGRQAATTRAAGLVLGFYHFVRPGSMTAQADYFLRTVGTLQPGDILVLDWEDGGVSSADKDAWIKYVQAQRPGHKVGLYCNTDFWKNREKGSFCGDFLWIADPNHAIGQPGITHAWTFHQYGSGGGLDRDVANFPTRAALRAWATPAAHVPTPPKEPAVATPQDLANNLMSIGSLTEKDAKGKQVSHAAGYYLAHCHADLISLHKKVDALTAALAALAPKKA